MIIKSVQRSSSDPAKAFTRSSDCEVASRDGCENCIIANALKDTPVWADFLKDKILQECPAGTTIFQEGTPVGFIYLLRAGVVKISVEDAEGPNRVVSIVSGHDASCTILNKQSLGRSTHSFTCEALSTCLVNCIPKATFNWLMKQEFRLAQEVLLALADDLDSLLNRVRSEAKFSGRQRLAQLLLHLKTIQPGQKQGDNVIGLDLSRQELASMIGVTRETFTRLLSDLSRRGIIKVTPDHIVIQKEKQLSMIAANAPI